jgi:hypothetical protein
MRHGSQRKIEAVSRLKKPAEFVRYEWLETAHICESVLLWLSANGGNCGARERSDLSRLSVDVAEQFLGLPPFDDAASLIQMILALPRLGYRKADVKKILAVCGEYIVHRYGAGQS